ncbi:peptidylprolyl isomerase [Oleispirillum naphthae]|uniref:peptidylprolyl isomerase n=1 Tax=Oleispirillum naphthae TaxID=2838853 RepID=UPI0030823081
MKRWVAALTGALFAVIAAPHPAPAQDALRIAAVVNDDVVSVFDLATRLRVALFSSRLPDTTDNRRRLAPTVLRSLIDERLQTQEAKRLSVALSDDDLAHSIAQVETGNRMPAGGLKRLAAELGVPYDTITEQIRAQALWVKVVGRLYNAKSNPSAEDIAERKAQLAATLGRPQYHVSEIFLPFDAGQNEADLLALAGKLVEQLRNGAPFAQAAHQFSRSPTAARGGDLGWVPQGQLERELDAALGQMAPGDVSTPIRTTSGYYILHLEQRRVVTTPDAGETRYRLSQIKLPISGNKALSPADRDKVVDYVRASLRGCPAFDAYGKTLSTPGTGPLGTLLQKNLPAALAATVTALPEGEPSAPLDLGGVATLLMVCERTAPSALPDDENIRSMLRLERLERAAERHLRDLRRTAVIDIRI